MVDHASGRILGFRTVCVGLHGSPGVGAPGCGLRLILGDCSVPRGRGMFEDPTRPGKQQQLGQELKELMSTEQALDQLIQSCSLTFKHLTEDKANKRYPAWWGEADRALSPAHIHPGFVPHRPAAGVHRRGPACLFLPSSVAFPHKSIEGTLVRKASAFL